MKSYSVPNSDATCSVQEIMSTMKPDYFIAHNGLPNILVARNRHVITQTMKNSYDRVLGNQGQQQQHQQIHPPTKNKRFIGYDLSLNQQAKQSDSEKNLRNWEIKESLRKSKSTKDLINEQIVKSGSGWSCRNTQNLSPTKCDNSECNRNFKRSHLPIPTNNRDNKLTHQRKYDNKIFRHDLPDRIVLPPLPV